MSPPLATPVDPRPPGTSPLTRPSEVTYHIPTSPNASKTTICLPHGSRWTSGLHFHTQHTEYLRVVRGAVDLYLDGEFKTISAAEGGMLDGRGELVSSGLVVRVDPYKRHSWQRADNASRRTLCGMRRRVASDYADDVVVEEWTDPADVSKPLFFWNLNRVVLAPDEAEVGMLGEAVRWALGSWWVPFQLFVIFWRLDNWPILWNARGIWDGYGWIGSMLENAVEYVTTWVVLFTVNVVGQLIGIEAVTEKRTPTALWIAWQNKTDTTKSD